MLAVLAAEVMTVTNPSSISDGAGLARLADHSPFLLLFLFSRLILHCAGASCGSIGLWALGKAENAHLSLSSHQDMYTFLSKRSRRAMPLSSF